jgi:hypothetical protein
MKKIKINVDKVKSAVDSIKSGTSIPVYRHTYRYYEKVLNGKNVEGPEFVRVK